MSRPIENRLTAGPYSGKMVNEVPNDYLKKLALKHFFPVDKTFQKHDDKNMNWMSCILLGR